MLGVSSQCLCNTALCLPPSLPKPKERVHSPPKGGFSWKSQTFRSASLNSAIGELSPPRSEPFSVNMVAAAGFSGAAFGGLENASMVLAEQDWGGCSENISGLGVLPEPQSSQSCEVETAVVRDWQHSFDPLHDWLANTDSSFPSLQVGTVPVGLQQTAGLASTGRYETFPAYPVLVVSPPSEQPTEKEILEHNFQTLLLGVDKALKEKISSSVTFCWMLCPSAWI